MLKPHLTRSRLARRDWLEAALRLVARTGVQGLKVQDLAATLGATTGSLYWHFADRADLLQSMVEHWAEASTEALAQQVKGSTAPTEERLLLLMRLIAENVPTQSDLAIRAWASVDESARSVVARADALRAGVVSELFRAMHFDAEEVAMRTRLFLCYESCERVIFTHLTKAEQRRHLERRHRLLCSPSTSA